MDNDSDYNTGNGIEEKTKKKKISKKKIAFISISAVACIALVITLGFITVKFITGQNDKADSALKNNTAAEEDGSTDAAGSNESDEVVPQTNLVAGVLAVAPTSIGDINITPLSSSTRGVEINSQFLIELTDNTSKNQLISRLSVKRSGGKPTDGINEMFVHQSGGGTQALTGTVSFMNGFKIEEYGAAGENTFILTFDETLENDELYNVIYSAPDKQPLSYAFQTVPKFGVLATTPGDDQYNAPVNTGIEITFNQAISGDFADYFVIVPEVNGSFNKTSDRVVFIPDALEYDSAYKVTIKKGLSSESGEVLEEDYSFTFRTEWKNRNSFLSVSGDAFETFLPDDEIFIELNITSDFQSNTYTVSVYEMDSADKFIEFNPLAQNVEIPASARLIDSMNTDLFKVDTDSYYTKYFIMLSKTLGEGYYLINIKTELNGQAYSLFKMIQVSALSVYSISMEGEVCFWVNDTRTGLAADGAVINIAGAKVTVGPDGTAVLKTDGSGTEIIKIKYENYPEFIFKNQVYDEAKLTLRQKYYSYLYTDRNKYKPTDIIDVFGVVKSRYLQNPIKSSDVITLKIGDIVEVPVVIDDYGAFSAQIPVVNMFGYSFVTICINGEQLNSQYITFYDYVKNSYILSAESDRFAYFTGETAEVELFATAYDNSPAESLQFSAGNGLTAYTNSDGIANFSYDLQKSQWNTGWQPYYSSLWFETIGEVEKTQSVSVPVVILPSDVMLEYKSETDDSISFSSNYIDRDAIEREMKSSYGFSYNSDIYRGISADINFTITIIKQTTTRREAGEGYDFINKVKVKTYTYETARSDFKTIQSRTSNGSVTVNNLPVSGDPMIRYFAVVSFRDTRGNEFSFDVYYGNYKYFTSYESTSKYYYFALERDGTLSGSYQNSLKLNETGSIVLKDYNNPDAVMDGKLLTVISRDKILSTETGNPQGTAVKFAEDYINNVYVHGAYFDGKYIYPISYPLTIYYDNTERNLDIGISFDKDEYEPGGEVKASIKVTDENGKPKKARVAVSVVDESVFDSPENNKAYALSRYYNSIYYYNYNYSIYSSYTPHNSLGYGGAEMGSGEGESDNMNIRKDFRDNPVFIIVETDANGTGAISFSLSDSVTSWRVTAIAITKDDYVGDSKSNIISTMPYYIDLVMTSEFIAGDDITALVKSFGEQFKPNHTEAAYTFELSQNGKAIYSETQTSSSYPRFNAGKLAVGEYTVLVKAAIGAYSDAMEENIRVAENGLKLPMRAEQTISDSNAVLSQFDMLDLPVKVTFTNGDIRPIMRILNSCASYGSRRTDGMAASAFREYFIGGLFDSAYDLSYAEELKQTLSSENGIPEMLYSSPDVYYTARFTACFPEFVMRSNLLKSEFMSYLYVDGIYKGKIQSKNQPEYYEMIRAAGYFTLAGLHENVLMEIQDQISYILNTSDQEQFVSEYASHMRVLYYAAALCALGADSSASVLMDRYPVDYAKMFKEYDIDEKNKKEFIETMYLYINTTIDPAAAYEYLKNKDDNVYVSDICEKINFLRKVSLINGATSEIGYTLNNKNETLKLKNFERKTLYITKEQYDNLNIKRVSGTTDVNISYYGEGSDLDEADNHIGITKEFSWNGNQCVVNFQVSMPSDAPSGFYVICDRLPSNMRYLESSTRDWRTVTVNIERQLVNVYFYYRNEASSTVNLWYNATMAYEADCVPGTAFVSRAFVQGESWGKTK